MAVAASIDVQVFLNSVDITDWVREVGQDLERDTHDKTHMGSGGWREFCAGLRGGNVTLALNWDYASSASFITVKTAWLTSTGVVAMTIKPADATIAATNPELQFNVLVNKYTPVMAKVGDIQVPSFTWPITGAVTEDTSP